MSASDDDNTYFFNPGDLLLLTRRVPTDTYVFPGVPHGFRSVGDLVSNEAWDRVMSDGIAWALSNPPAVPFKIQVN